MSRQKYYGIAIYSQNREDYRRLMVQEQDVILNILNRCGITPTKKKNETKIY